MKITIQLNKGKLTVKKLGVLINTESNLRKDHTKETVGVLIWQ